MAPSQNRFVVVPDTATRGLEAAGIYSRDYVTVSAPSGYHGLRVIRRSLSGTPPGGVYISGSRRPPYELLADFNPSLLVIRELQS